MCRPLESERTSTTRSEAGCYLSGQGVVVVVGNYVDCSWIYEVCCASACTSGFITHVEAMSPPLGQHAFYAPRRGPATTPITFQSVPLRVPSPLKGEGQEGGGHGALMGARTGGGITGCARLNR